MTKHVNLYVPVNFDPGKLPEDRRDYACYPLNTSFRVYSNTKLAFAVSDANRAFEKMTFEEKRKLCQMVFSGEGATKEKLGLSILWPTSKKWRYRIEGHFIQAEGGPLKGGQKELFAFGAASHQKELVTKNGNHCINTALRARRSSSPILGPCE